MKPERWKRVEELYHAALDLPEGKRAAFLDGACEGNDALRREVESLLRHEARAGGFIEEPAVEDAARELARDQAFSWVGRQVDSYQILSLLGAGGMGEVYRARDPRLDREIAIKVLPNGVAGDPDRLNRFRKEAKATGSLNHSNILTVHDVGSHEGRPYLVTELLEGGTLRERMAVAALSVSEAIEYAAQIARGLAAAGEKGIVHRDLKPENLFITKDGQVKILDFGLARVDAAASAASSGKEHTTSEAGLTDPGMVMGTVGYMSPEQVRGEPADARSDIFALGTVLYEMISGRQPFQGANTAEVFAAILHEQPKRLTDGDREIPDGLEPLVLRCLEKPAERRYQTAQALRFDLEALASGRPLPSALVGEKERSPYPGLSPFTEADAADFFGREAEVEALWKKLGRLKLLGLIGPSGAGKTSFLRAGLMPSAPTGWGTVLCTPGDAPLGRLGQALVSEFSGDVETLRQLVRLEDPDTAVVLIATWRRRHAGDFGLELGGTFRWNSGTIATRRITADRPERVTAAEAFDFVGITDRWIAPGAVGSLRNPAGGQIDLRIRCSRPLGKLRGEAFLDVFNVLNNQDATRNEDRVAGSGSIAFGDPIEFRPPRRFYLGARVSF